MTNELGSKLSLCTLFDSNFLLQGLTMIRSVERYLTKPVDWNILALDSETELFLRNVKDIDLNIFNIDTLGDLELGALRDVRPWREFCWTSAACFLGKVLFSKPEGTAVAYIDADCFFFRDIYSTLEKLNGNSIAIHEHRFSPDRQSWLFRSGRFNVGLVGGVKGTEFDSCVSIWRQQVIESCISDFSKGKCGDQTYLNDWPEKYKDLIILSAKGVGLAPWNLNNYKISNLRDLIYVDEDELDFFHFHGLEIGIITKNWGFFLPAPGYQFQDSNYLIIYQKYINSLQETIISYKLSSKKSRNLGFIRWVKFFLQKQIVLHLYKKS